MAQCWENASHTGAGELFRAGLIEGLVPENDTGADMENITEAYFSDDGQSALWVAEFDDSALMKAFGHEGSGVFTAPTAIKAEVERQYQVTAILAMHRDACSPV